MQAISAIVTAAFGWMGEAFTLAGDHNEMYIPLGIGVVGAAIGLFRRATRVGGSKRKG